ncbi:hypothetical protein C8J57DRAFT_1476737 [Mycena rebaudengoi]|nr:hypothetical protein C8J57DRAFT_1476737 [Mycena rebaudengoi]
MSLQDIGEGTLLKILAFCDVYTVLRVSITNKPFRCVALTKQLWLHLMQDLVSRGLLDSPSTETLDAYSTGDIIDEIRRIVCGPATWAPRSSCAPAVLRQLKFSTNVDPGSLIDLRLIHGGTHALLNTLDDMRLYEVRTGRCVWTRASTPGSFAVDMAEGGKAARILLVPPNYSQDACITIQEVYLPTGESREILSVPLPQDTTMNMYWSGDLREDFFVLHAYICSIPGGNVFTLVDWRRGKQILLSYNTGPTIDLKPRLLRDHLLVVYPEASRPYQRILAATAFTALEKRWQPLDAIAIATVFSRADLGMGPLPRVPGEQIPTSAVAKLHLDNKPMYGHSSFEVCVRENPAHHDNYKIMLYLSAHATPSQPWASNGRLFTYTFTPSPSPHAQPAFQLRYIVHSLVSVNWTAMSYAGYAIQWPGAVAFITDYRGDRADARVGGTTVLKASPGWVKMYYSSLNGAVLGVAANGSVIVCYFQ